MRCLLLLSGAISKRRIVFMSIVLNFSVYSYLRLNGLSQLGLLLSRKYEYTEKLKTTVIKLDSSEKEFVDSPDSLKINITLTHLKFIIPWCK